MKLLRRLPLIFVLVLIASLLAACGGEEESFPEQIPPEPSGGGFRVAITGDQGLGAGARRVIELIRSEGAALLIHVGDYDYRDDPEAWEAMTNAILGVEFPVLGVVGNHEASVWESYQSILEERLAHTPEIACEGDFGIQGVCVYRDLAVVLSGAGTLGDGHEAYIRETLGETDATWRVCVWHSNQRRSQVTLKADSVGWGPYEACREHGAFVANGHAHVYARTKTLTDVSRRTVDPNWTRPEEVRVGGGSSFILVSGLGGRSIFNQERCRPTRPPYGCNFEWASIYTTAQEAVHGALFIDFGVDGDPTLARGYFKNVRGEVIDRFTIVAEPP